MGYTRQVEEKKIRIKVGLTIACMNMKKLGNILWERVGIISPNAR